MTAPADPIRPRGQSPCAASRRPASARAGATGIGSVPRPCGGATSRLSGVRAGACALALSWLPLLGLAAAGGAHAGVTDEEVEAHIGRLKEVLISSQLPDGSWAYSGKDYRVGATALAVLALKYAGLPNGHPTIASGVSYIVENETTTVYTEGLVPCALELVDARRFAERIWHSAKFLMDAQSATGNWHYRAGSRGYDNSNSQFAVLGLAAAERCGVLARGEPARRFAEVRERAVRHWQNSQGETGGWAYTGVGTNPTLSMTCAGIASLYLLGKRLEVPGDACGAYTTDRHLQKGLACLAGLLGAGGRRGLGAGGSWGAYAMYALERVGVFLDLRTIGECDWYREGASAILRSGVNQSVVDAAFHLLFLAKGNAPVAIAKWRWDGDWQNDRGDAKAWVTEAGRELKLRLDSWECRLDDPRGAASKASLIFVNGHGRFEASERELDFLRRFLLKKGTVVAEACCGRKEFLESFKEVMTKRLFPGQMARFRPIPPEHPVCSLVHDLDPKTVGALEFSVACRKPRMLLFTRDFSCALNEDKGSAKDLDRARKVATNLLAWALVTRKPGGKLARVTVDDATPEEVAADELVRESSGKGWKSRFAMGRLVHLGDWEVDEKFFPALHAGLEGQKAVPRFERELPIRAASEDLFHVPFLFVTGHEPPELGPQDHLHLRTYLQNGGFMFVSACCSSDLFDAGARQLIRRVLPNDEIERIPPDDPIWSSPFDCRGVGPETTAAYRQRFGDDWAPLFGVRREGRWALVYSPVDICCDLQGDLVEDVAAYRAASAVRLIGNIISCALSP